MPLLSFIRDTGKKIFENPAAVAGAPAAPAREGVDVLNARKPRIRNLAWARP